MIQDTLKEVRKKKNITQEELAELLGVSRGVVVSLEKGDRDLQLEEARKLADILGIRIEALSDESVADFSKYKQMIIHALACMSGDGRTPKTKLAKILYLADFTWFYHHVESMSGMRYRKIPYGPVPDDYFRALEELEYENLIDVEIKKTEDGYSAHLVSLTEGGKKASTDEVAPKEKELIEEITNKWKDKSTRDIVGFTHQQLPYKLALDGEIISYALIGQEEASELY